MPAAERRLRLVAAEAMLTLGQVYQDPHL